MGLGKTLQVLAYLEKLRKKQKKGQGAAGGAGISSWQLAAGSAEVCPGYAAAGFAREAGADLEKELAEEDVFLTVTTYGMVPRLKGLREICWDCLILDEAQAIKNPMTKQTREIKKLTARMRIAMTGTPIENDLTNLWSLFDFLNKGLMGTSQEFKDFNKSLKINPQQYGRLKSMVAPFMLRRVKTDKRIIADLPEKLETADYVTLSRKQAVLYRKIVADMEERIRESSGIERRGIVLATILKLKQVCNHPDQYLGQQAFSAADSGKFAMLRDICETIYEKRERVLVFTPVPGDHGISGGVSAGNFSCGRVRASRRNPCGEAGKIVENFQGDRYVPFIVLSVKAGEPG